MDIEIKNIILDFYRWRDVKGFRTSLKDAVDEMEALFEKRKQEDYKECVDDIICSNWRNGTCPNKEGKCINGECGYY